MENNKKTTFLVNSRWQTVLKNYPPEIRVAVYDAMFEYAETGKVPELDKESKMAFLFIKMELDEYQSRYEETVETNRINGRMGGAPRGNQNAKKKKTTETTENNRPLEKQPKTTETTENNHNDMICNDIISEKEKTPKGVSKKKAELSLPFSGKEFLDTWEMLCQQPRWKKKSSSALQLSLKKLSKYPEKFAVHLMETAIANNYQGVVFDNTEDKFRQWQRQNPAQESTKPQKVIRSIDDL